MSSCGNAGVEEDALMPKKPKFDRFKMCIKCKAERGKIVIRHAVYCKTCFTPLVITKFRRCIDPHINAIPDGPRRTALKASGNLLIGFSGGLGSTVLLDLISSCYFPARTATSSAVKGGKAHPRKDRVWTRATVCYVEISGAFLEGVVKDRTEDVLAVVRRYSDFDVVALRLEDAFDGNWWQSIDPTSPLNDLRANLATEDLHLSEAHIHPFDPLASLRTFISSLPTATAVRSALSTLIRLLLLQTARTKQASHVALGTSLTSLSISLISTIAQGGGFNLREESYEEWKPRLNDDMSTPVSSLRIVRPLHKIGMKECGAWAWWHGLLVPGREHVPGMKGKQTVSGLTKDFVVGLERDYPATVSTIARTCAKLAPKDEASTLCAFCARHTQRGVQEWKARISIRTLAPADRSLKVIGAPLDPSVSSSNETLLTPHLCYACHTTFTSCTSRRMQQSAMALIPLPVWTQATLAEQLALDDASELQAGNALSRNEMKASVTEFLIHD